jgi:hypothetical protein
MFQKDLLKMKTYLVRSLKTTKINVLGKPLFNPEDSMIVTEINNELKNLKANGYISIEPIIEPKLPE